jgi:hypothetical protein
MEILSNLITRYYIIFKILKERLYKVLILISLTSNNLSYSILIVVRSLALDI